MVTCLMICCWPTFLGKMQFDQNQLQLTFLRVKSQTCPLCIFSSNISPILFFRTHSWGSMLGVSKKKTGHKNLKWTRLLKLKISPQVECSDFGEGLGPWELFFYLHLAHNGINHHILSVAQKVQKTERVFSTFSTCFSNEKYFWKL